MSLKKFVVSQLETDSIPARFRPLLQHSKIARFRADAAITVGQAVKFDIAELDAVFPTGGEIDADGYANDVVELLEKVIPTSVATGDAGFVGIALDGVSAGEIVYVCVSGFCGKILLSSDDVNDGEGLVAVASGTSETYAAGTHTSSVQYGFAASTETDNAGFVAGFITQRLA